MNITITQPPQGGQVTAIASKSHAHRVLIAAALADTDTRILCNEVNEDILATVRCLEALGAYITYADGAFTVQPLKQPVSGDALLLDCGESGSTLRFHAACCVRTGSQCILHDARTSAAATALSFI